jgi:hypothetical protein
MKQKGIGTILLEPFYDPAAAKFVADKTGARIVTVANDVGTKPETDSYFKLISNLLAQLTPKETENSAKSSPKPSIKPGN